ncbi:hypothetical protein V8G54_016894 [Vigna mungo]|uniref:Uncharacterized protein n=1 Tax=Vigna mungo TaxID=3915 RepID=A0AAQ3S1Q9_VIGMU
MGRPGWPEFAFSTASMARKRIVLTDFSTSVTSEVAFSTVLTGTEARTWAARRRRERGAVEGEGRSDGETRREGWWEEGRGVGRRRAWESEREEEEAMVFTEREWLVGGDKGVF